MKITVPDKENIQYVVQSLEGFEKDKALKNGLRSAAGVFIRKGKSNLKQRSKGFGTGSLSGSFVPKVKRNSLGALAGFRRSTRLTQWAKAGNHAHLVDSGTTRRYTKGKKSAKKGIYRGVMPANHFWTDAKVSEEGKAMQAIYNGLQSVVERIKERRS